MRVLRKIFLWLVGLTVLAVGLAFATFYVAPVSLFAGPLADLGRAQLGRALIIAEASNRRLYPSLGAEFTGVALKNADWAGSDPLLTVKQVSLDIDARALLSGAIRITQLTITEPKVSAAIREDGEPNWRLGDAPGPQNALEEIAAAEEMARALTEEIAERIADPVSTAVLPQTTTIEGGTIRFDDRRSGRVSELTAFDLTAKKGDGGALLLEGSSDVNGAPTKLTARLADPFALWGGRVDETSFTYQGDGVSLTFDGAFDLNAASLSAKGAVKGSLSDDRRLTAWIRRLLPKTLDPLGALAVDGELYADRDRLDLSLDGAGDFNAEPLSLTLKAQGGRDWRRGELIDTALTVKAGDLLTGGAMGDLTIADDAFASFDGRLEAQSADWSRVRQWAGATPPLRPVGAIALTGALKANRTRFAFTEAALTVEEARALADLTLDWSGERLQLNGSLREGPLDLLAFAPGRKRVQLAASDGAPVGEPSTPVSDADAPLAGEGEVAALAEAAAWSTSPLPLSVIDGASGLFTVDLKGAALGDLDLGATDVDLKLGDGGIALEIQEIALYGGALAGAASLTRDGDAAKLAAALTLNGVDTEAFLAALGRQNWLRGPIRARLETEGRGASMAGLMGSLSGDGAVEMRDGALLAINFAAASLDRSLRLFGAVQDEPGVTPFRRASAPFFIEGGVVKIDNFRVNGDVVRAEGVGKIDIGARRVDFTVTPTGFGQISFLGIDAAIARSFPVRLLGPWSAVRVFLDRSRASETRVNRDN